MPASGSRKENPDNSTSNAKNDVDTTSDVPEPYTHVDKKRNDCCLDGIKLMPIGYKLPATNLLTTNFYFLYNYWLPGFRQLYENEQLFDVTLCVGGKEFRGHKSLLAASSDYFRAMFTTELAEKK